MINNKIKVFPYDSNHNAIHTKIKIEKLDEFIFEQNQAKIHYNFTKTNWKKFDEKLTSINFNIPEDRGLTNDEINTYT